MDGHRHFLHSICTRFFSVDVIMNRYSSQISELCHSFDEFINYLFAMNFRVLHLDDGLQTRTSFFFVCVYFLTRFFLTASHTLMTPVFSRTKICGSTAQKLMWPTQLPSLSLSISLCHVVRGQWQRSFIPKYKWTATETHRYLVSENSDEEFSDKMF